MASGSRLFSDSATLRNIPYPGSFSTEFMFRASTNPFSEVQFVPERIVQFSISPEGIRFYKVEWQETWLPEHHLMQYQDLVDIFWRNQNEHPATCGNSEQLPNSSSTSGAIQNLKSSNSAQCGSPNPPILQEKSIMSQQFTQEKAMTHQFTQEKAMTQQFTQEKTMTQQFTQEKSMTQQFTQEKAMTQQFTQEKAMTQQFIQEKSMSQQFTHITNLSSLNNQIYSGNVIQHTKHPPPQQIVSPQLKQDPNVNNILVNAANKNNVGYSDSKQSCVPNPLIPQAPSVIESSTIKHKTCSTNLNGSNNQTSDGNIIQHTKHPPPPNVVPHHLKQDPNIIRNAMVNAAHKNNTGCNDTILNLPNPQITMSDSDETVHQVTLSDTVENQTPPKNELTNVLSRVKKTKSRSIQLEGFELVNIENTLATEEEIKLHAQELLRSFSKRQPKCPTGTGKLPHACFFCNKIVPIRKRLREHQLRTHFKNAGEFLCKICEKRFLFRRQLEYHMITHSDNRNFVCKICGLTCKRISHLHTHMEKHKKECNYRCDVCHKNFKVQLDLKEHCLSEHKNQTNICNVCKQTLKTAYSVYMHSMRHSGTREYTCEVCNASFKTKQHLANHENVHAKSTENIKCPTCDKEFVEIRTLQKHIQHSHEEIAAKYRYEYVCTICNKDFAYKGHLDKHMKTHEGETVEERKRYATKTSRKRGNIELISEEALTKLINKVEKITDPETGEVKLRCKLCRRREFKFINRMERHLEEHKAGIKSCDGKNVLPREALSERQSVVQKVSSKPNSFQCRMCKSSFKWKSCLQSHMKKCTSISKGAGKRKATLKAKERLSRKMEDASSDDEISPIQQEKDLKIKRGASMERKATLNAKAKLRMQIEDALSDDEISGIQEKGEKSHVLETDNQHVSNEIGISRYT